MGYSLDALQDMSWLDGTRMLPPVQADRLPCVTCAVHQHRGCCRGLEQQQVVDEQQLVPVLNNIHAVFSDVHECINSWCSSSRLGSIATVMRNLVAASWFQVRRKLQGSRCAAAPWPPAAGRAGC
jgi:hypothetical protein